MAGAVATKVVGQSVIRKDARAKVTGKITYGVDTELPGMLYGKLLQSPYAHARIVSMDTSEAERMPGVRTVITAQDLPRRRGGRGFNDEWLLARDKVIYIGEPIAAVAADTEEQARDALQTINVEYQELPAVFDPEEAMKPGTPIIHEDLLSYPQSGMSSRSVPGTNILNHFKIRTGDIEKGFAQADYVFEDTFRCQYVHQAYMEPEACVTSVDVNGKATVWGCDRVPHASQAIICNWLDMPLHKVRIIPTAIGGSFGGKAVPRMEAICIALSGKSGRPVKMVATRDEVFTIFGGRHAGIFTIKTGVKKDGTITARQVRVVLNTGAVEGSAFISSAAPIIALGAYRIPNVWVDSYVVYTNSVGAGSYRGVGSSQAMWAGERQIDLVASRIGMDPLEFRLKNIVEEGDVGPTSEVFGHVPLKECLQKTAERIGWDKRGSMPPNRGIGMAIGYKINVPGGASTVFLRINPDGGVMLLTGGTDVGEGFESMAAQMVSEELGVPYEDVEVVCGDTDSTPTDSGPSSSRQTFFVGNSILNATQEARRQILEMASSLLKMDAQQLELVDGQVKAKGASEISLGLKEIARAYHRQKGVFLSVTGYYKNKGSRATLDPETGQGKDSIAGFRMYGAEGVEVEVDPETGLVRVLKVVTSHHLGKAINPSTVKGQLEGGTMMGLGAALMEEVLFEEGRIVNPSFFEYKIPTIVETPEIECNLIEGGPSEPESPYGATGIGESTNCSVPPAIGNAVFHAVGASVTDTPITPERVLEALDSKGASS